jgi:hypothetical protein
MVFISFLLVVSQPETRPVAAKTTVSIATKGELFFIPDFLILRLMV